MEKEENQNSTSSDQNQDVAKESEKLEENSVDENNLSKNSYDTLMYLADGSGENPINFHLIASVFNDLCSEFFGKTKDG